MHGQIKVAKNVFLIDIAVPADKHVAEMELKSQNLRLELVACEYIHVWCQL